MTSYKSELTINTRGGHLTRDDDDALRDDSKYVIKNYFADYAKKYYENLEKLLREEHAKGNYLVRVKALFGDESVIYDLSKVKLQDL